MKRLLIMIVILFILVGFTAQSGLIFAGDGSTDEAENNLNISIDSILENLDLSSIQDFLNSLTDKQKELIGTSLTEKIKAIVNGDIALNSQSFLSYIGEMLGVNLLRYLPVMLSVLGIIIVFSIVSSTKGNFASDSVQSIVSFATISLVLIVLLTQIYGLIGTVSDIVLQLKAQINVFMPILLTLMAATGASSSVAVYQPSVAILSSGIAELISYLILPGIILAIVFSIIGSLNSAIKLNKMSAFFSSSTKWMLGTAFFLFMAFLSVQGITASVYDGISMRTAKFAVSKYVPIIGGYLSEGLNLVLAGSVLVKNAVGLTGVIMLFASVLPAVIQIAVFSISLNLTAAIAEPIDGGAVSGVLSKLSKNITLLVSVILAIAFLYFIFLVLLICTGNLVV